MAEKSREALRALMEAKRLERLKSQPAAATPPAAAATPAATPPLASQPATATPPAAAASPAAAGLRAPSSSATPSHGRASSPGLGELLRSQPRSVSAKSVCTPSAPPRQSLPNGLDFATELAKHVFGHALQPEADRKRRAAAEEESERQEQLREVAKVRRCGEQGAGPDATGGGASGQLSALRAAFVSALPGIAASARVTSARAAQLNEAFAQFVAASPPVDALGQGCEQYLAYASICELEPGEGLEAACRDFLSYLRDLRAAAEAGAPSSSTAGAGADLRTEMPAPVHVAVQDVQWHSAGDAREVVRALRAGAVCSVVLRGAPVDAHDNDTICAPAARALAEGLAANIGTIATLALTDMKMGAEALRVVLHALGGSGTLRRLDLSNLCSRWTVANTLGRERGALLAELIRGWARRVRWRPSWWSHRWRPRARQVASEGSGRLSTLARKNRGSQISPTGRARGAGPRQRDRFRGV